MGGVNSSGDPMGLLGMCDVILESFRGLLGQKVELGRVFGIRVTDKDF